MVHSHELNVVKCYVKLVEIPEKIITVGTRWPPFIKDKVIPVSFKRQYLGKYKKYKNEYIPPGPWDWSNPAATGNNRITYYFDEGTLELDYYFDSDLEKGWYLSTIEEVLC